MHTQDKVFGIKAGNSPHTPLDSRTTESRHLKDILNSFQNAIVAFGDDLEVIEVNEAAGKLCGFSFQDRQKAFDDIEKKCSGRCREVVVEAIRQRRPIDKTHLECAVWQRPGQVVSARSLPLLDSQKKRVGTIIILDDETPHEPCAMLHTRGVFSGVVGQSPAMRKTCELVASLAHTTTTVLITGESGTGKELAAEALHYGGPRAQKPLVKVNCAALSETLLESELFGHVRGAFTGAEKDRTGRFQKADGGTIFLDEIGDISAGVQARLLRVLERMEFERVGDSTPVKVDVRIVAATNKSIPERIRKGVFREDLYYRLKVVEVPMPPLRERRKDIPLLVEHFIGKLNAKLNKTVQGVSSDVMKVFMEYGWPGNIRELEHAIEHGFIYCHQPVLTVCDLPHDIRESIKTKTTLLSYRGCDEHQAILKTLDATYWNKSRAAALLGVSRRTFYRKMKEYNIFRQRLRISRSIT